MSFEEQDDPLGECYQQYEKLQRTSNRMRDGLIEAIGLLTACMLIVTDHETRKMGLERIAALKKILKDTRQ
jgi:hypothetical protein